MIGTGSIGILAVDECYRKGLRLATLNEDTRTNLDSTLPSGARIDNPIDPTPITGEAWGEACKIVVEDPEVSYFMRVISSLVRPHELSCDLLRPVIDCAPKRWHRAGNIFPVGIRHVL